MNKIKFGFFVFFFMTGLVLFTRVSASSYDLYEYAGLSGVAILGFEGQDNLNNYDVNIKTNEIAILTGKNSKEYRCWSVQGTGYTDTLGEVFFNYNNQSSYICNDGKRRGRAKLSAGGRIDFESSYEGSIYSGQLQKEKYENKYGEKKYFYHKTGSKAYTEGLGFWNWEVVKTKFDYIGENLNLIDFENSNLNFSGSSVPANGTEANRFTIEFLDENYNRFDYLILPRLEFTKDTFTYSDEMKSGLSFSDFNDPTYLLENIEVSDTYQNEFYSIVPGTDLVYMNFGSGYILTGNSYWNSPFTIDFKLEDGNGNSKILQYDNEKAKLSLTENNINIIDYDFDINLNLPYNWSVEKGLSNAKIDNQWFDFRVYDENENSSDFKWVNYVLTGNYDIEKNGNYFTGIKSSYITNEKVVYLNKNIDSIEVRKLDCNQKLGNAKSWCKLGFEFNNEYGQNLSNMSYDIVAIEDLNKDDGNYSSFDLDEFSESNYITGFYFSGYSSKTNDNGLSTGKMLSYKPVRNAKLSFVFSNITGTSQDAYDWHTDNDYTGTIKNISFDPVVELAFSGIDLGDGIAINSNNEIEIEYGLKDGVVNTVSDGNYSLSGKIISDLPNSFEEGGTFTGNFGTSKNQNIYISGDYFDYITYYNDYYKYKIDGLYGDKRVRLKPNKRINSNLVIVPKFMGSKVMGLINKGFSLLTTHSSRYFGDGSSNKIVGTSSNGLNKKLNKTKMEYENKLRGINSDNITGEKSVNLSDFDGKEKYYKCSSDGKINLIEGEYTNQNEIVLYGCPLSIKGDILKTNKGDSLKIVSFDSESKFDFNSSEGWIRKSNIYIHPNVNTIQSNIITDGTIFTIKEPSVSFENIFFGGRGRISDLQNQLYINGQIISKNTYGGGVVDSNNQVVLPGGYKVDKDNLIYGKKAYKIAQAFDINFWRSTYNRNNGYDTDKLSALVESRFGCTGQDLDPYQCTKPVLIEK